MREPLALAAVGLIALLALAMLAACGGENAAEPAAAPAEEPAISPQAAPGASGPGAEPTPAGGSTSFPCIAGDPELGKAKYAQLCASCHGPTGAGDGVASAGLNPKPAHHDDGAYMNGLDNDHLVKVITEGGPAVGKSVSMAPWGAALGPQGVLDVVAFVRTLADPPYACP